MKTQRLTLPIALGLSLAALSTAQEARPVTAKPKQAAPAQEATPGAAQRVGKTMFAQHTALMGQPVFTSDSADKPVGVVSDMVIDGKTAMASHVIVTTRGEKGAEMRALPYKSVAWRAVKGEKPQCVLSVSTEKLNSMKGFDATKLDQLVGQGAVEASAERVKEAVKDLEGKDKNDAVKGAREAASAASSRVMATKLADFEIYAPDADKAFATVENLVFDAKTGQVAFTTVALNDETYLVPWQVFKVRAVRTADGASMALTAPVNAEGMVGAPTINADEKRVARNPRFRAEVYKHYGVEAPKPAGKKGNAGGMKQRADDVKGKVKRKAKSVDGDNG